MVAYKIDLDQFVQFCIEMVGEFNVKKVDAKIIRSWIVELMENDLSARSVNRKVTTIKSYFKFLLKEQIVDFNPTTYLTLPKIRKKLPNFVEENVNLRLLFKNPQLIMKFGECNDQHFCNERDCLGRSCTGRSY